jgi:pimeloyl-ACP methyl ester carboxylesterase
MFGISEGGTLSLLFACSHPQRAESVIVYGSWARRLAGPDYPFGPSAQDLEAVIDKMDRAWASGEWWDGGRPSGSDDARHRLWWARYLRMSASPAMAQNAIRMNMRMDIRDLLPRIAQPALILHRVGDTLSTWGTPVTWRTTWPTPRTSSFKVRITGRGWATSTPSPTRSKSSSPGTRADLGVVRVSGSVR